MSANSLNRVPRRDDWCAPAGQEGDCRCMCGSLLARVVAGCVELKCRRCKRTLLVPLSEVSARPARDTPGRAA